MVPTDKVAWHADKEQVIGVDPTIVSVSLENTRKFEFVILQCAPLISTILLLDSWFSYRHEGRHAKKLLIYRVPSVEVSNGLRYNLTFRYVV